MKQRLLTMSCWTLVLLLLSTAPTWAQKAKPNNKKGKKEPKRVKATKSGNSAAAIKIQLNSKTREEKNTMDRCPLHNRRLSLSDNYRADASDYTPGDNYPFAYQLNYRRYCPVCTRIMDKEAKKDEQENKQQMKGKTTFERCPIHNAQLKGNPDYNSKDAEAQPDERMPHARQYCFKHYCKVCTKIHKIENE